MKQYRTGLAVLLSVAGAIAAGMYSIQAADKAETAAKESHESHEQHESAPEMKTKEFTFVAIRYEGTTIWVPGTMIVNKGTKIKL